MRKKPNLASRMEHCASLFEKNPESLRGRWSRLFPDYKNLALEIGCGKGRFTAEQALLNPQTLLVAVERVPEALVVAMERALALDLKNICFLNRDAKLLDQIFAPQEISEIFLNFSDPWPRNRDAKHRLTAPDFLRIYASLLAEDGCLRFKTDNCPLFDWTLLQLRKEGWEIISITRDLHENGVAGIMTDYEERFHSQGVPICQVITTKGDFNSCALSHGTSTACEPR